MLILSLFIVARIIGRDRSVASKRRIRLRSPRPDVELGVRRAPAHCVNGTATDLPRARAGVEP